MNNYWPKVKIEYTNKKWDLDTMKIKIKNLEKIIPSTIIGEFLSVKSMNAKSELDAYYLTYYELKDAFLKYKRSSFGDTTKNIRRVFNLEDILNEQFTIPQTMWSSSNSYIKNSSYGSYDVYDSLTNMVVDYDGRLLHY